MTVNEYATVLILDRAVLLWPWAWLLLPLPWLVWRLLPPAPPTPRTALRVPFYARAVGSGTAVRQRLGDAGRIRPWRAALIWTLLVMAAARPGWLEPASGLVSLFAWPLGLALGLATLEACRLCRQGDDATPPRRLRTLPGQVSAGDGHDAGV